MYKSICDKQYIFYIQNKFGWVQVEYPPLEKTYKNRIVSEDYIMNNTEKYGQVKQDDKNNLTHIYLYRHEIALTQREITIQNESLYPIDLELKKMFRCPLESCERQPLNNHFIEFHLKNHCEIYHNNDNKQYIFYFQNKYGWKFVEYPLVQTKYNNIIVSEDYIMNNTELYGEVQEDENHNSILVFLYPHDVALTQKEIDIDAENPYPIDLDLNKMFRCPLQSCKHKPLNNYFIESHLLQHCQIYHNNENKQYIFRFQTEFNWKELEYPPILSTNTNPSFQNND